MANLLKPATDRPLDIWWPVAAAVKSFESKWRLEEFPALAFVAIVVSDTGLVDDIDKVSRVDVPIFEVVVVWFAEVRTQTMEIVNKNV